MVKGINFVNLTDAGDPIAPRLHDKAGADELTFLDITASSDARRIMLDTVRAVAKAVYIPLRSAEASAALRIIPICCTQVREKVSVNSFAVAHPELLQRPRKKFGSQCVVVAIDAKWNGAFFEVYTHGGRVHGAGRRAMGAKGRAMLGAGELLLTSMDADGTKGGL